MSGSRSAKFGNQHIASAGIALSRARTLLLQPAPQNLDIACSALAMAIAQITELQKILTASPSCEFTVAVVGLREEVTLISRLLEYAAAYHVKMIQGMIEAYNSPAPQGPCVAPARRLFLEA